MLKLIVISIGVFVHLFTPQDDNNGIFILILATFID